MRQEMITHSRDLTPEHYEWAYLGEQASSRAEAFKAQVQDEGIRNPEDFVAEVQKIGSIASWQIVTAFEGLTKRKATDYSRTGCHPTCNFEDLVSVGNIGVYESSGNYFPNMQEISPATYFGNAAKWAILRYLDTTSSNVRIPTAKRTELSRLSALRRYRDPQTGAGISSGRAYEILDITDRKQISLLERARLLTYEMGSIDSGFNPQVDDPSDNDYSPNMRSIFEDAEQDISDSTDRDETNKLVLEFLLNSDLSDLQKNVLIDSFGITRDTIEPSEPKTNTELADKYDISANFVRTIVTNALAKLRKDKGIRTFLS